jgi:subtilisin-like proprotein convertase family protein
MRRSGALVMTMAIACAALPVGLASGAVVSHDKVTVSDAKPGGDGDGFIEPTETVTIKERLKNDSGPPLSGVRASLSSLTPFLAIDQPSSAYPNIDTGGTAENTTDFKASTTSAVACGANLSFRLDVTTDQGNASPTFAVETNGGRLNTPSTDVPQAIPDNNPTGVSATANVPSGIGNLVDLNVSLAITHTFNADLDVTLTHGATVLSLFTDVNGGGDGMSLTLDDEALTAIEAAGVPPAGTPLTGTFKPETPASLDAAFAGQDVGGAWTLKVVDDSAGDTGSLTSFAVDNAKPCNRAPLASFVVVPEQPAPGQTATLVSTSQDFDGSLASFAWDLDNDGAFDDATGIQTQRTFPSTGTFPIRLTVTDNKGEADTVTQNVTVPAPAPGPTPKLFASFAHLPKQRLSTALRRGLRVPVKLNLPASVKATAALTRALAKRFGLAATTRVVVARGSKKAKAGTSTVLLKFTTKAKRKLRGARSVKLRVAITATGATGATATATRTVTLKR